MITDTEPSRGDRRVLRVALMLSLLVHGTGAALYGYVRLPPPAPLRHAVPQPTPDQFVTISDSMRVAKKAVVEPPHRRTTAHPHVVRRPPAPAPVAVTEPRPQVALLRPKPRRVAAAPTPKPVRHRARHELAKIARHAKPQPPKTVAALPPPTPQPTLPPATPRPVPSAEPLPVRAPKALKATKTAPTAKTVALAEAPQPPAPGRHARLTPEQIAQIDADLAKSIAQTRAETNPLRVPKTAAAAPRRYKMSADSVYLGTLRSGEGTYYPIAAGTRAHDGYTYYRCMYAYQWADGTLEKGVVPWLVRFAPSEDPMLHPELTANGPIGLPPPPPGFHLTPDQPVGRALRGYFPNVVFAGG